MKKIILSLAFVGFLWSCSSTQSTAKQNDVAVTGQMYNTKRELMVIMRIYGYCM